MLIVSNQAWEHIQKHDTVQAGSKKSSPVSNIGWAVVESRLSCVYGVLFANSSFPYILSISCARVF